jgi:type I restriction enzyme, R subunit
MAKFDAEDRQSRGGPIPEEIQRLLGQLIAESTASEDVLDIYDAAGMPAPTLTGLNPSFISKTQQASNPHLAIEALHKLPGEESTRATRGNVARQRTFSERITELMNKYTNQQLTSAEVVAELIELAKEVAAEASRGARFSPPLNSDELAFYEAVAQNESPVVEQGDDVRAKLRSSIKRLLIKHGYTRISIPA